MIIWADAVHYTGSRQINAPSLMITVFEKAYRRKTGIILENQTTFKLINGLEYTIDDKNPNYLYIPNAFLRVAIQDNISNIDQLFRLYTKNKKLKKNWYTKVLKITNGVSIQSINHTSN